MGKIKSLKRSLRKGLSIDAFEKRCGCKVHTQTESTSRLYRTSGKDFKKSALKNLIDKGLISRKASYVCEICLSADHANNTENKINNLKKEKHEFYLNTQSRESAEYQNSSTEENLSESCKFDSPFIEETVNALKSKSVSDRDMRKLCEALGMYFNDIITQDMKLLSQKYRDINIVTHLNPQDFLLQRPLILVTLLSNLVGVDVCSKFKSSYRNLSGMCVLLEHIYSLRNKNFIGIFAFSLSLLKWSLTGSKLSHSIDNASSACGSVTTMKKALKEWSASPNTCFEQNDIDVFFDNTQRIGKTRRVREGGSTPMDVATNVVFIQRKEPSNIQTKSELKPSLWPTPTPSSVLNMNKECIENVFNSYKRNMQQQLLTEVSSSLTFDEESGEFKDTVFYKYAELNENKYVCNGCGYVYISTLMTCPECNYNPNFVDRSTLYGGVPSEHPSGIPNIRLGEIIAVNPNSHDTVKEVLLNLQSQCEIGKTREWVRVGCDGVPYSLADKLISNLVLCKVCSNHIDTSKETIQSHFTNVHPENTNVEFAKVFDSILLVPGAGHIELNFLRALFKFCRHIFLEKLAQKLGFCSKNAKEFIINCGSHHLSWQISVIIYESFAKELVRVYLISCFKRKVTPSMADFVFWRYSEVKNPNYNFYYDLTFNLLLGLKLFRSGIRKNNSKFMLAGRQAVSPLIFIGKHRIYQHIIVRDLQIRSTAPDEVLNYIEKNESFSVSGDCTRGEGGDYIMEHNNRVLKGHLPPGVPSVDDWVTASRSHKPLKQIRKSVFNNFELKDPSDDHGSTFNHDKEVQMFRTEIRKSNLLENTNVEEPLKSLDGQELHPDLVNFMTVAQNNFSKYVTSGKDAELSPVFITLSDEEVFNNVNSWTKSKIVIETQKLISQFNDESLSSAYSETLKDVSKGNKNALVLFYEEVKGVYETELAIEIQEIEFDNAVL